MQARLPATVIAAAGCVATTAALAVPAATTAASKLSAPVMHEVFTPLPCTGKVGHRTTLQLEGCAEQRILASDRQIDQLNAEIFQALRTAGPQRRFIAAHNAWLSYRHSFCQSESDAFQGGTLAPVIFADCEATLGFQHAGNLRTFYGDLTSE